MQVHKQLELVRKRVSKTLKDIQDYQKRWEDINTRGAEVANKVVNSHLRVQYLSSYQWGYFESCEGVKEKVKEKLVQSIESDTKVLRKSVDDLTYLYNKMVGFVESLKSLMTFLNENDDYKSILATPLYSTLMAPRFAEIAAECVEMYSKELLVKAAILGDIQKIKNRDLLSIYVATWSIQPYITKQLEIFNTAINAEIGLLEEQP
eukprot:Phypoly_transcript_09486.p1 GENE.Phypoly_transcript_09486~~Phypoly_transcript_09486.p1  ORF type:complete len:206 (+),score=36.36 Phypoly_transcript_09486:295-912(+)